MNTDLDERVIEVAADHRHDGMLDALADDRIAARILRDLFGLGVVLLLVLAWLL
jgi:hypothetical protein